MIFGKVDIDTTLNWADWTWEEFLGFYESSLKGQVDDTPETVAKVLGIKVPVQKPKAEKA
jgi:hypothetical protein